jgi:hypothetical protein
MALIAEALVEEWLTRQGYFTIRSLKVGQAELDLLGCRNVSGQWQFIHAEVQVSYRPVKYITNLSKARQEEFSIRAASSAKRRQPEQLRLSVEDWVNKKFFSPKVVVARNILSWNGQWRYLLVHGKVRFNEELEELRRNGNLELLTIEEIVDTLKNATFNFSTTQGTDLIDLMGL